MKKIYRIGTLDTGRGRRASLYVKAEVRRLGNNSTTDLSFSGVIGPLASGNALGSCGQIDMEFSHRNPAQNDTRYGDLIKAGDISYAPGWNGSQWMDLLELWHEYHLKDVETIPASVIAQLEAYPDADKAPAWV